MMKNKSIRSFTFILHLAAMTEEATSVWTQTGTPTMTWAFHSAVKCYLQNCLITERWRVNEFMVHRVILQISLWRWPTDKLSQTQICMAKLYYIHFYSSMLYMHINTMWHTLHKCLRRYTINTSHTSPILEHTYIHRLATRCMGIHAWPCFCATWRSQTTVFLFEWRQTVWPLIIYRMLVPFWLCSTHPIPSPCHTTQFINTISLSLHYQHIQFSPLLFQLVSHPVPDCHTWHLYYICNSGVWRVGDYLHWCISRDTRRSHVYVRT